MKITEEPIKELIVHEACKMDLKGLVLQRIRPDGSPTLLSWCDGVVYTVFTLGERSWDEELLKGRYHIIRVCYAEMQEYKPMIEISTDQFGGLKIPVVDNSAIDIDRELIRWLKAQGRAPKK